MLSWTKQFNIFCLLDTNFYSHTAQEYELLLAAGVSEAATSLREAENIASQKSKWLFGHLSYELNHSLFSIPEKADPVGFASCFFFVPEVIIAVKGNVLTITADEPERIYNSIQKEKTTPQVLQPDIKFHESVSKAEYLKIIDALKQHIHRGECYEINFCIEFFAENVALDPYYTYKNLLGISPNPFSAFYRNGDSYLMCASPERFLAKRNNTIFSQPIKGTIRRDTHDSNHDHLLKQQLYASEKDRAENVMIVDLVRNDLTKICKEKTVAVRKLFHIESYPQVHQMVSTITGELQVGTNFEDIIAANFPMGSMTGAPKDRVMQLIDQYEPSARGIFSGSVGYIAPGGDFDFNVVIRSIMYNTAARHLSYKVGSGITFYSNAEQEWEECLLKAQAIKKVLS